MGGAAVQWRITRRPDNPQCFLQNEGRSATKSFKGRKKRVATLSFDTSSLTNAVHNPNGESFDCDKLSRHRIKVHEFHNGAAHSGRHQLWELSRGNLREPTRIVLHCSRLAVLRILPEQERKVRGNLSARIPNLDALGSVSFHKP